MTEQTPHVDQDQAGKPSVDTSTWVREHSILVAGLVAGPLVALVVLSLLTSQLDGRAGSWAQIIVGISVVLLVFNWIHQWRSNAPKPTGNNRLSRIVLGLVWLVPAGYAAYLYGTDARLPNGYPNILKVELAGNAESVKRLLFPNALASQSFAVPGETLRDAISADWWFIVSYVVLLAGLVLWMGVYYRLSALRAARWPVVAAVVGAGVLDCCENYCMWKASWHLDPRDDSWSWAWAGAAAMSWPKLVILVLAIAYILGGANSLAWSIRFRGGEGARGLLLDVLPNTPDPVAEDSASVMDSDEGSSDPSVAPGPGTTPPRKLGIALSGGGIRAASMSLGALQTLELAGDDGPGGPRLGWNQADEVTAISGGSNLASGWHITRARRVHQTGDPEGTPATSPNYPVVVDGTPGAWALMNDPDSKLSPEEQHLLDNLGYLVARSPRGADDDVAAQSWDPGGSAPKLPKPASYRPSAYATVITGFLLNVAVLLLILWVIALPAGWGFAALSKLPADCRGPAEERMECFAGKPSLVIPAVTMLALGLVALVLWVLFGRRFLKGISDTSWQAKLLRTLQGLTYGAFALGVVLVAVLVIFPYLISLVAGVSTGRASLVSLLGTAGTLGTVGRVLRKPAARFAPMIGGLIFIVLVTFVAAYWAWRAAASDPLKLDDSFDFFGEPNSVAWWLIGCVLLALIYLFGSPEWWSLAPFYRGKLRLAYATRRNAEGLAAPFLNEGEAMNDTQKEPGLHTFLKRGLEHPTGSPLTICATATVSSRAVRTHYGIPALSVTFDPDNVRLFIPQDDQGTWAEYRCDTISMDRLCRKHNRSRLTTMLAIAISSAAVSPAMGKHKIGPTSMLLTFANVRLGVWMPNPRYVVELEKSAAARARDDLGFGPDQQLTDAQDIALRQRKGAILEGYTYPRIGLGYLFKEFFGIHDLTDPYLYLTDGGHWENTGLVELLRRGNFSEIVCVDADPGAGDAVRSVSQAIDLAALECDAQVNIGLDPLRATVKGTNAPEYSERSVNLGFFELQGAGVGTTHFQPDRIGVLWYSKPALTADMPAALLAHRETHPDYPRISTVDQFFDTSTFIAYRNLGRYNAQAIRLARSSLLEAMGGAEQRLPEIAELNEALAALPDNQQAAADDLLDAQDPLTARLLRQLRAHPDWALSEFDAFSFSGDEHWTSREVTDLVRGRTATRAHQASLYLAIKQALLQRTDAG